MGHKKAELFPFPLLMLKVLKDKMTKRAMKLDVNRSWLATVFIDQGYRSLTDKDIIAMAEKDHRSVPHRKLKL